MSIKARRLLPVLLLLAAWAALPLFPGTSAASASGPLVPDPIPKPPATHPRLFVSSPADIEELRARTATGLLAPAWQAVVANSHLSTATEQVIRAKAFRYLLGDGLNYGQQAVELFDSFIRTFNSRDTRTIGSMLLTGAMVYDWCYDLLTPNQRADWQRLFFQHAQNMEIGFPPTAQGAVSGHGAEDQVLRDQLAWAIAVYNEYPIIYETVAGAIFERYIPVRDWFYPSGKHHRGDSYGPGTLNSDFAAAFLFKKMSGVNVFDRSQESALDWYLYARRPDGSLLRDGDSYEDDQHPYGQYWRHSWPWMMAAGYYKNGYLQREFLRNYAGYDGTGTNEGGKLDPVLEIIYADPFVEPLSVSELPLTRYFGTPHGGMIARTGWTEGMNLQSNDVIAEIRMNEFFFSGHQHLDAGAFQIYYKGALAIDSGNYGLYETAHHMQYSRRTIAHNTLLVYDPDEMWEWHGLVGYYRDPYNNGQLTPLRNDGGQFWPNWAYEPYDLEELLDPAKGYHRGRVLGYAYGPDAMEPDYSYIKGDLTGHYRPEKLDSFLRSFLFLNLKRDDVPAVVIIYDQVTARNPEFKKTWLLHSIEQPIVDGNVTTIMRTSDGYGGKLVNTTVLPAAAEIRTVGGPGLEYADYHGTNWPETTRVTSSSETGAWRVEVSPKEPALSDTFLHVMQVMDTGTDSLPVTHLDFDLLEGVAVADRVVLFGKGGERTAEPLRFTVSGAGEVQVVIADVESGLWDVAGPIKTRVLVSEEGGVLHFTGPAGEYVATHTGIRHPTLPFADDFADEPSPTWQFTGSWDVADDGSKVLRAFATGATAVAVIGNTTWTDYTAQVDVKIENLGTRASASVGLLFRYQDPNNYYAASYDVAARKLTLLKRVGGIVTELAVKEDVELVPGRWHTVKAEAAGRVLRVYVDGQLILAARDGSLSGGGIGFVQIDADVHYDRVRVDLPATPAPMTLPVAEDFEDGVADGWRVIDGNWRVVDDGGTPAYYAPVSDALARTVVGDASWSHYTIEVKLKIDGWAGTEDDAVGILVRYVDPDNYYALTYHPAAEELRIDRKLHGRLTRLVTLPGMRLTPGLWHTLKVEVEGPALRLYLYGRPVLTATDDALARGGAGLIQQGGDILYDAVSVRGPALVMGVPLPFHDDFEQGPSALWNVVEGDWTTIADGTQVYHAPITDDLARTTVGDLFWKDYTAEAKVKVERWAGRGNDSVGFLVRFQDPYNYYILNYNASAGEFRITKQLNGQFTRLAVKPGARLPLGEWHTLRAVVDGARLELYVNGELVLSAVDPDLRSGGFGLIQTDADVRWDDVHVTPPGLE